MTDAPVIPDTTKAVVFDAYGTLFDVHSAVRAHHERIGPDAVRLSEIWRDKQLEYSWVLSLAGRYEPFSHLTERALDYALARHPRVDRAVRPLLLDAYRNLDAYPDVRPTLERLRARHLSTGILSNGDPTMLLSAVASARLDSLLDPIISVDREQVFKTSPRAYNLVISRLAVAPDQVLFVSSNRWDIAGATAFGFPCIWVNRQGLPDEYAELAPRAILSSLTDLV